MADGTYDVSLYGQRIGVMISRRGLTTFQLLDSYLDQASRPTLGQHFEKDLRRLWKQSGRVPVWFSNLLPEDGQLRDFLADHLGIKPTAELDLLIALGQDLPGAITIEASAAGVDEGATRFERPEAGASTLQEGSAGVRFSAAGIQLKLSMISERNSIRLPGTGELGGHFVKFAGSLARLPNNEFQIMTLAKKSGLTVPEVSLRSVDDLEGLPPALDRLKGTEVYLIERFDRSIDGGRVHIEDLNQVVAQWPERKYEGASYEGVGRLIRSVCGEEDYWEFFDRLMFCFAVGNEDAHLKNWSLAYPDRRRPRLAPLYDVVSTVIIPGLDRGMALKFSGDRRAQALTRSSLAEFAKAVGVDSEESEHRARGFLLNVRDAEGSLRSDSDGLTKSEWQTLDDYRRTVPLIADLYFS